MLGRARRARYEAIVYIAIVGLFCQATKVLVDCFPDIQGTRVLPCCGEVIFTSVYRAQNSTQKRQKNGVEIANKEEEINKYR